MDARGRLVRTVPVVPLESTCVAIHAQEDLDQEVEVGVVEQLLPNQTARPVGVDVLQVKLAEDPVRVAL